MVNIGKRSDMSPHMIPERMVLSSITLVTCLNVLIMKEVTKII